MTATRPRWLPDSAEIDVKGVPTRYYETGSGEPVLLVYGGNFGSSDSAPAPSTWDLTVPALAGRFRPIVLDKLGQGFTGNPLRDEDYSMAAVVQHIADFIEARDLPPVHLVGHSRGGYASVRLALLYPERVRSVTIVSSGTLSPGVGTNEVALAKGPHPAFSRDAARWIYQTYSFNPNVVDDAWLDAVMAVMAQPKYKVSVDKMVGAKLSTKVFLPELAQEKRETLRWIEEGRLQRPVQIIWGQNDPTVMPERGFEMFQLIAASERRTSFTVFNEAGHFSYREHPERFNAQLVRFLDGVIAEGALK